MTADLVSRLLDPDPEVHEDAVDDAAARAMDDDQGAVDALRDVVLHFERFPIGTFERTLNRLYAFADPSLEPAMMRALESGVSATWYLTAACARAGFRGAVPYALTLLGSPATYERSVACEVLGDLDAHEAVPHLIARLGDPEHVVREAAARALAGIGGPDAVDALRRELVEHRFPLLGYVASALGRSTPTRRPGSSPTHPYRTSTPGTGRSVPSGEPGASVPTSGCSSSQQTLPRRPWPSRTAARSRARHARH